MGVAEILIVVLLGLTFVSFFVTALYCRVQEKMDVKRKKRNDKQVRRWQKEKLNGAEC